MLRDGYITPMKRRLPSRKKCRLRRAAVAERFNVQAPHFSVYVRKWLEEKFGTELVNRAD